MNRTPTVDLLSLIGPAAALAVFLFLERRSNVSADEQPQSAEPSNAKPKFAVIPSRK
jgi:hypothetical protein